MNYIFSPELINAFFDLKPPSASPTHTKNTLVTELTGGALTSWVTKSFPSSKLTDQYFGLHRAIVLDLCPSKHVSNIFKGTAEVLYCLGKGLPFNVGEHIFKLILTAHKTPQDKPTHGSLIFPSLITSILLNQDDCQLLSEQFELAPKPLVYTPRGALKKEKETIPQPSHATKSHDTPQSETVMSIQEIMAHQTSFTASLKQYIEEACAQNLQFLKTQLSRHAKFVAKQGEKKKKTKCSREEDEGGDGGDSEDEEGDSSSSEEEDSSSSFCDASPKPSPKTVKAKAKGKQKVVEELSDEDSTD